jgi:SNF2 family DNA or RNA helicase
VKHWTPRPYQIKAVQHLIDNGGAGLFLEPGLGKTSCTLAALELFKQHKIGPTLIVAPLRVCYSVWPAEVKKWGADVTIALLHGKHKLAALESDADVYLINPEGLRWLAVQRLRPHFKVVVLDESTKFKNARSQRYKSLEPIVEKAQRVICLTGTPAANNLQDLWAQVKLLDGGERLGRFITHFRKRYFRSNLIRVGGGRTVEEWVPHVTTAAEITSAIEDICMHMRAEDYLTMPPLIYNTISVELPPEARDVYDVLETNLAADLGRDTVTAQHAAVVVNKLRQITGGNVYADDSTQSLHTAKIEALLDLVDEQAGQPLLVAVGFTHEAAAIQAALKAEHGIVAPYLGGGISATKSDDIAAQWNAGRLPVLLAHPASVAHGLNLQAGGHAVCWYTLTWSLEEYDQFNRRVYRQGQKNTVIVHHLTAKDTVDERVAEVLQGKDRTQRSLLNLLKEVTK